MDSSDVNFKGAFITVCVHGSIAVGSLFPLREKKYNQTSSPHLPKMIKVLFLSKSSRYDADPPLLELFTSSVQHSQAVLPLKLKMDSFTI